ncbi:Myb/SANT-like DNA-binding domain-containing protein 4 [Bienertia sinuspersici]
METLDCENETRNGESSSSGPQKLDPISFWFDNHKVTQPITEAFHQYFNEPWRNWSEVNSATKDQWFNMWKQKFTWEPELDKIVRKDFNKKAGKRLKDLHNYVTRRIKGVKSSWMSEEVHKTMMKRIQEADFIKRSEQAMKNKRGGSLDNVIEPGHFQGSISASEHTRREYILTQFFPKAAKNRGILPKDGDLYLKFHSREQVPGKGKELVGSKAKQIMGAYERKLTEYKEKGIEIDPNAVYLEVVGGRKRGLIPGLDTAGDLLYEKSSSRSDKSSTYTPSILSQLSQRVEQQAQEIESQRLQLEKQRLDMEAQRLQHKQERLRVKWRS